MPSRKHLAFGRHTVRLRIPLFLPLWLIPSIHLCSMRERLKMVFSALSMAAWPGFSQISPFKRTDRCFYKPKKSHHNWLSCRKKSTDFLTKIIISNYSLPRNQLTPPQKVCFYALNKSNASMHTDMI